MARAFDQLHPFIAAIAVLSLVDAASTVGVIMHYGPFPASSMILAYLWYGSPLILLVTWAWARRVVGPEANWLWLAAPLAFSAWIVIGIGFVLVVVFCTFGSCDF